MRMIGKVGEGRDVSFGGRWERWFRSEGVRREIRLGGKRGEQGIM